MGHQPCPGPLSNLIWQIRGVTRDLRVFLERTENGGGDGGGGDGGGGDDFGVLCDFDTGVFGCGVVGDVGGGAA